MSLRPAGELMSTGYPQSKGRGIEARQRNCLLCDDFEMVDEDAVGEARGSRPRSASEPPSRPGE
jgi:hypothetical protein